MSKVIQNIKSNTKSLSQNLSSLLHRGQKSKDPYYKNNNRLYLNSTRLHRVTLGTGSLFNSRCSSTFRSYINKHKNLRIAGFTSALSLAVLSVFFVYPIVKNLNSAEAATGTAQESSLTLNVSSMASVNLLVSNPSGNFASSDTSGATSNFTVATNNVTGYTLTIAGSDDKKQLVSGNNTIDSITSATSLSSGFNNGEWGYKPSKLDSSSNSKYLPGPTTTATTLDAPNSRTTTDIPTTTSSTSNSYTIDLGIKADYSTAAGNYSNTYVLAAVPNPVDYIITYAENTGDVTNLPNPTSGSTSTTSITLTSNKPTRTGYNFSGWCLGTVSNSGTTCTGTTYASGGTFYIDKTTSNITTLYAVWTIKSYTLNITNNNTTSNPTNSTTINFKGSTNITVTPADGYYLSEVSCPSGYTCTGYTTGSDATGAQTVTVTNGNGTTGTDAGGTITLTAESAMSSLQDFTAAECSAMTTGTTEQLKDSRDNQTYTIAKLADGNCWMDNLNLNATNVDLTSSNTNLSTTVAKATFNGWKKTSGTGTHTAAEMIAVSGTDSTSKTAYGTLYNYCAASAGTVCIDSTTTSTDFSHDICPKGWRLPTGGSSGEFQTLYDNSSYNTNAKMRAPIANGGAAFALAGYFYNRTPTGQGSYGYYLSSTRYDSTNMYLLRLDTSNVVPADYDRRNGGFSIRCVKKSATEELQGSYMQDMTPALADSMATGQTLTLKDSRDEQSYTVKKLDDGNLWMIDNLNLTAPTVNLTSSNTNVSSTVAKSTFNDWKKSSGSASYTAAEFIPVTGTDSTSGTAYGTLYNYCAASAGTVCVSSTTDSTDFSHDICPKGWRLPTGGSSGEFQTLYDNSSYNTNAKMRAPIANGGAAFALAGNFNSSTPTNQGSDGRYWSSTRYSSTNVYVLRLTTSIVNPASSYSRYYGFSIRCVLNDTRTAFEKLQSGILTMQDIGALSSTDYSTLLSQMTTGTHYTATDSRDGNDYQITKLGDGKLWMTQNLRYMGDTVGSDSTSTTWYLKSATSNVSADKTMTMTDLTSGNTYDAARYHKATSDQVPSGATFTATDMGVWYNYAAASAMTITGSSNTGTQTYDICPKGWRLPTDSEQSGITSYKTQYSPVTGGCYSSRSLGSTGNGGWWSATSYGDTSRYYLYYNGSSLSTNSGGRDRGYYVRCIRSS